MKLEDELLRRVEELELGIEKKIEELKCRTKQLESQLSTRYYPSQLYYDPYQPSVHSLVAYLSWAISAPTTSVGSSLQGSIA